MRVGPTTETTSSPELKEMKKFRHRPFAIEAHVSGNLAWVRFRYALAPKVNAQRTAPRFSSGAALGG